MSLLPYDIIQDVLSYLPNDAGVVGPLARISRAWTAPAQDKLLRHVIVSGTDQWSRLLGCLRGSPHLGPLVRKLEMREEIAPEASCVSFSEAFPGLEKIGSDPHATTVALLSSLRTSAPPTLHSLEIGLTRDTYDVFQELLQIRDRWNEVALTVSLLEAPPVLHDGDVDLGAPSIRTLKLVEACYPYVPSVAFSILRGTRFQDLETLQLHFLHPATCFDMMDPVLDVEFFSSDQPLPAHLRDQVQKVEVEVKNYWRVRNAALLPEMFARSNGESVLDVKVSGNEPTECPGVRIEGGLVAVGQGTWQLQMHFN